MIALKNQAEMDEFVVVHPLFDVPEQKRDASRVGKMKMSMAVRVSLLGLRVYILAMGGLLCYHVLDLAGMISHHVSR